MKKLVYFGGGSVVLALILVYIFLSFTHTGRVWGLYAFAAFKSPVAVKVDCIKDTNARVHDKFLTPLKFSEKAKNDLREYWHFSYYRHCLFENGYDFYGNVIESTTLTSGDGVSIYRNPFGKIHMEIPEEATLIVDNVTEPDQNDFLVSSVLQVGETSLQIVIDRSYKLADAAMLQEEFAGFEGQILFPSPYVQWVTSEANGVHYFVDGPLYGAVVLVPERHIVTVYAQLEDKELIDAIARSIEVIE